jgi:prevent-host-death family protein
MGSVINIHEAKTHLSKIVDDVAAGAEVIIAKAGKPMARLSPINPPRTAEKARAPERQDQGSRWLQCAARWRGYHGFWRSLTVRLILDTHLLLWALGQPARLSAAARKQI